jgi:hypothetical protein
MKPILGAVAVLATVVAAVPASATNYYSQYPYGGITRDEAHRLRWERAYIEQQRRYALADGYLSHHERRRLRLLEHRYRQHVWRERHD